MFYFFPLTLFALPSYIIRFKLLGVPTNVLMVWLGVVIAVFLFYFFYKNLFGAFVDSIVSLPKYFKGMAGLFFTASIVSLFVGGVTRENIGQWIVLFVEPGLLFCIAFFWFKKFPAEKQLLLLYMYAFVGLAGVLALVQYFTLFTLPPDYWGNSLEPKRAIGFFEHPNGFALFITPLLAFLLPDVVSRLLKVKSQIIPLLLYVCGGVGLLLSLSRGGWLGFAAAAAVYVIAWGNKQIRMLAIAFLVSVICIVAIVPNLRYRVMLPFMGEKSAISRLSLWDTGFGMVKDSPIVGKGIRGFSDNWYAYNKDPHLEHYNYPHNFILNFWVDTGLLGVLSFIGLVGICIMLALKRKTVWVQGAALFVIALCVHGLIDIPYLKNDLAALFWLVMALALSE